MHRLGVWAEAYSLEQVYITMQPYVMLSVSPNFKSSVTDTWEFNIFNPEFPSVTFLLGFAQ